MADWMNLEDVLFSLQASLKRGDTYLQEDPCTGVAYVVSEFLIDSPVELKIEGDSTQVRFPDPIGEGEPPKEANITRLRIMLRPVPCIEAEESGE